MAGRGITVRLIDLGTLRRFVTAADLAAAGKMLLALQEARIASGVGTNGKNMKKLSPEYAKEEKGGNRVRTLRRTGTMLDSRAVLSADEKRAVVGFRNKPKHAYVNQARTPFAKATKDERRALQTFLIERINARLLKNLDAAKAGIR